MKISDDIILKEATLEDAATIYHAIDSHRDYLRIWLPFIDNLQQVSDEEAFLASTLAVAYEERNIVFVIECKGIFCGLIGFVATDNTNHRTEIGYWLLPEYQGQGIMTDCVRRLCRFAIEERGMNRIQIHCATENKPSNAIPLRLGFQLEGTERQGELLASGNYADLNLYSLLKEEADSLG